MPYKSEKQKHFMQAVAHNPEFAKKAGVPQSVGKEFERADASESVRALDNATRHGTVKGSPRMRAMALRNRK